MKVPPGSWTVKEFSAKPWTGAVKWQDLSQRGAARRTAWTPRHASAMATVAREVEALAIRH
jgi:hypothetical protein